MYMYAIFSNLQSLHFFTCIVQHKIIQIYKIVQKHDGFPIMYQIYNQDNIARNTQWKKSINYTEFYCVNCSWKIHVNK